LDLIPKKIIIPMNNKKVKKYQTKFSSGLGKKNKIATPRITKIGIRVFVFIIQLIILTIINFL